MRYQHIESRRFCDINTLNRLAGGTLRSCYAPSLEMVINWLAGDRSIDWLCNVEDMIVASIMITSIIFPGIMISPLRCVCFFGLIYNVILAHDFTRRYCHHGCHTRIILSNEIWNLPIDFNSGRQSLAKYHVITSITVNGVPISEWNSTSISAPFSAGSRGLDWSCFVVTMRK